MVSKEKNKISNEIFFRTIITLIIPITLQNLISSSLNMIDNLMIGELGEAAIAGTGLVNQYFFIFTLTLAGINAGASIFISQFWGRRDEENIGKMLGLDIVISLIVGILFSLLALFYPEKVMRIFVKDIEVIRIGAQYLKIISVTFIMTAITQAYSTVLRCTGIAGAPMYGSLIGVLVNAFLNWVLIFGNLGMPALGVQGAAIATGIARFVEMIFVLVNAYTVTDILPRKITHMLNFDFNYIKVYFRTSIAVILNEIAWSVGIAVFSIIYAQIGIKEVASMQIATTINNMFMVLSMGIASSAAIIIGNKIGANEENLAMDYSKRLTILAPIVGLISGIGLWIAAPYIVGLFNIDENTVIMTTNILKIMAIIAPLRFYNVLMIVGVFRGGGDTLFTMLLQLSTVWFFAIPVGYISATVFNLQLEIVFLIMSIEEIIKLGFGVYRFKSGKWLRNVLDGI